VNRAHVLALLVTCTLSCAAPGGAMNPTSRPAIFEVQGEARDASTLAPLPGATVVLATDTGLAVRSEADASGRFTIALANGRPHTRGYWLHWSRKSDAASRVFLRVRDGVRCVNLEYAPEAVPRSALTLLLAPCDQKALDLVPTP
jgi:hypothetical protein